MLVSVNPFRWIKGLCDDENVLEYKGRFRYEVQPNIFALAEDAYREMKNQQENQCIIITYASVTLFRLTLEVVNLVLEKPKLPS